MQQKPEEHQSMTSTGQYYFPKGINAMLIVQGANQHMYMLNMTIILNLQK